MEGFPPEANYREKSDDPDRSCGGCAHFASMPMMDMCRLWHAPTSTAGLCDQWEGKGVEGAEAKAALDRAVLHVALATRSILEDVKARPFDPSRHPRGQGGRFGSGGGGGGRGSKPKPAAGDPKPPKSDQSAASGDDYAKLLEKFKPPKKINRESEEGMWADIGKYLDVWEEIGKRDGFAWQGEDGKAAGAIGHAGSAYNEGEHPRDRLGRWVKAFGQVKPPGYPKHHLTKMARLMEHSEKRGLKVDEIDHFAHAFEEVAHYTAQHVEIIHALAGALGPLVGAG